jgi:hypothetical protein
MSGPESFRHRVLSPVQARSKLTHGNKLAQWNYEATNQPEKARRLRQELGPSSGAS